MYIWFLMSVLGAITTIPIHFLSVEHLKLQERYGKAKGRKICVICGLISGWGFFIFWIGIWLSLTGLGDSNTLIVSRGSRRAES
jgi:hypothetical protein